MIALYPAYITTFILVHLTVWPFEHKSYLVSLPSRMTIDTRLTGPGRASQRSDLPAASHPEPLSTSDDPAVADDTQYSIHPFVRKDSEWTAAGGDVSTTPKLENTCKVADLAPFDNSSPLSVSGNNVPLLPNADRRLGYDTTTDTDPAAVNVYQVSGAKWYSRERYAGALLMNLATAFIPALYGTLSIMWVGGLGGAGRVAVAVSYTYAGVVVECFNEGLPRAVWYVLILIDADRPRAKRSINLGGKGAIRGYRSGGDAGMLGR